MPPVPNALGLRGQVPWWTRLQAALIRQLNRFFAPPQFVLHPEEAARKSQADLQAEEFGRSRQGFLRLRESLSLRGGVALDLACGGGVKTASLSAAFPEARLVVGIDVDAAALRRGRSFSCQHGGTRVAFLHVDAGALPFKDQSIDLVVSENAFEHVPDPDGTLREVARVLKDRGTLSLRFFPMFFSRYGSHLWDYLCVPWAHVWASPEAVVAAYRQIIAAEPALSSGICRPV
jgi:ubiquinone/menaquinone biosynthesis C-methylase UbiE